MSLCWLAILSWFLVFEVQVCLVDKEGVAVRVRFLVQGQVQGVGFRPFVFNKAGKYGLRGYVRNHYRGVEIVVCGEEASVVAFGRDIEENAPPLARIVAIEREELSEGEEFSCFDIRESERGCGHGVLISPDIATCSDCLKELFDPSDRRFLFPFINCTNCGPRFTITRSIPYDRDQTSMACFDMCQRCTEEYESPLDRRFHAQPNCCPLCGPRLWLQNIQGEVLSRGRRALEETALALLKGEIVAIKGLGGFHISCCADKAETIEELRRRKMRPSKPFALMAASIEDLHGIVRISRQDRELLEGHIRPIVLMERVSLCPLPPNIAPDTTQLGVMLPYTPLHHVLFYFLKQYISPSRIPLLIMTSGNRASEPICRGNREALDRLRGLVSLFLFHDRDILIRCDDSVVRTYGGGKILYYRRARGFVPSPVFLKKRLPCALGVGAELKNTICLIKEDHAFVSQYIGDLKNLETYEYFLETIEHYKKILDVSPRAIGADLHPDYLSTRFALEQDSMKIIQVQHHHAHILSVIAEKGETKQVIGVALDGAGLGDDGQIWGGEVLLITEDLEYERMAHLYPVRLPGGDRAVEEIWRMAISYLWEAEEEVDMFLPEIGPDRKHLVLQIIKSGINSPLTTSCGRLFDAIAALTGIKTRVTYEGEGAIALENIQDFSIDRPYKIPLLGNSVPYVLDTRQLIKDIVLDIKKGKDTGYISRRFHLGLCLGFKEVICRLSRDTGIKKVALGGGVFQNKTLIALFTREMEKEGLELLVPSLFSPNDEAISLGQAYFVAHSL